MAAHDQLQPKNIPLDIIFDILSRLPLKSLSRFECASKDWLALISDVVKVRPPPKEPQKLIITSRYPLSFYTLDLKYPDKFVEIKSFHDDMRIVGCCHGLVLLHSGCKINNIFYLWNPLTGKHKHILTPKYVMNKTILIEGLGYDFAADEFKVVIVVEDHDVRPYNCPAYVFSCNSVTWNSIKFFEYQNFSDHPTVVLNGCPHWIVQGTGNKIVYFDPHNETFGHLPPVPTEYTPYHPNCRLTILGQKLCWVIDYRYTGLANNFHIWVMNESSWSKLFVMPRLSGDDFVHVFMPPLCTTIVDGELEDDLNGGEVLVYRLGKLTLNNLKGEIKRSHELPRYCSIYDTVYYEETLARP